jgi:cyanophycinase-like exopeptidase
MKRDVYVLAMVLCAAGLVGHAQQIGPKNGSLLIVGGNMQDAAIVRRFIDLAGGADANIIIVPTAGDADEYDQHWTGLRQFREQGARNLTVLHTRDRKLADTEAFAKPIASAGGVFFLLRRNRQFDLAEVIEKHPELLGIGIDEDTAIVVDGDRFDVIGRGYVAINDPHKAVSTAGTFYLLAPGDRFDLVKREASRRSEEFKPLERVAPRKP